MLVNNQINAQFYSEPCGVTPELLELNSENENLHNTSNETNSTAGCAQFETKTIRIHVHYILRKNGTGNFNETNDGYVGTSYHNSGVTGYTRARTVIDMANYVNSHNFQLWIPNGNTYPVLSKRLYYELASVNFIRNDTLYDFYLNNSLCNMETTDLTYGIQRGSSINVYFLGDSQPANSGCASSIPVTSKSFSAIVNKDWKGYYDQDPLWNGAGHLLCHEVGHCTGLIHTRDSENDGCTDTEPHPDCWEYISGDPDCGNWANITNNTMAWIGGYQSSLSPCQIEKMHANLNTFLCPYANCDPVTFPEEFSIVVSPNPNLGDFEITFKSGKSQKIQFVIYDKLGNVVIPLKSINAQYHEKVTEKISTNLSPDLYIVIAQGEDGSYAYKQISIN